MDKQRKCIIIQPLLLKLPIILTSPRCPRTRPSHSTPSCPGTLRTIKLCPRHCPKTASRTRPCPRCAAAPQEEAREDHAPGQQLQKDSEPPPSLCGGRSSLLFTSRWNNLLSNALRPEFLICSHA